MLDETSVNEDGTIQIKRWEKIIIVSQLVNNDGLFLPSLTFIHNKDSCLVNESIKKNKKPSSLFGFSV